MQGNCNNIRDTYAKICVPDVIKDLNVKVFNLMSRTNETRHIKWHETCTCICRLDAIVCDNKQRWNINKCRCECKELIDKGVCDKVCACNPSNCEYECDKVPDVGQYLDYKNCKYRKNWLINQLMNVMKVLKKQVQFKLIRQSANIILAYCTLYSFQYSLQLMLELLLILFTISM